MKAIIWMFVAALGITGCGDSMRSETDQMRTIIDDVRQETDGHQVAITGATSLVQLGAEMDRHGTVMDDMMGGMGATMDGMSHCTGAGMQDMREMRGGMVGEMDHHGTTMGQVPDMAAATTEVTRHTGVMHDMLDGMDDATGRMGCM